MWHSVRSTERITLEIGRQGSWYSPIFTSTLLAALGAHFSQVRRGIVGPIDGDEALLRSGQKGNGRPLPQAISALRLPASPAMRFPLRKKEKKEKAKQQVQAQPTTPVCYSDKQWEFGTVWKCVGCLQLERHMFPDRFRDGTPRHYEFHNSFQELSECAEGERGCRSCRVFRRALLLRQPSAIEEQRLLSDPRSIEASISKVPRTAEGEKKANLVIEVHLHKSDKSEETAPVLYTRSSLLEHSKLEFDSNIVAHTIVRKWLNTCDKTHQCREKAWSTDNPTRLLRIHDPSTIQLIETSTLHGPQRYVALSYCWGNSPAISTKAEQAIIKNSETIRDNIQARYQPFSTASLPRLIKDAITFTHRLSIPYIWIDAFCIIQHDDDDDNDWVREAPRMHMVYGNAALTLCVSSCNKATEPFLRTRDAWRTKAVPCELGKHQILTVDENVAEANKKSPLAKRGWTLQEDFLSPRKIYWFGQTIHWSCEESHWIEGVVDPAKRPVLPLPTHPNTPNQELVSKRAFLSACRTGTAQDRLDGWNAILTSYSQRNLSYATDRFAAINGVAKQYLSFQALDRHLGRERYLCGLWYHHLPQHLLWSVVDVASHTSEMWVKIQELLPSWSPLSLPFATPVKMGDKNLVQASDFCISTEGLPDSTSDVDKAVADGENKLKVRVSGRFRAFMSQNSDFIPWNEIGKTDGIDTSYNILAFLGRDIHFADPHMGRLIAVEGRRPKSVAQLDYREDVARLESRSLVRVFCVEVCESAMLLLEKVVGEHKIYRRIGVCFDYWGDFFAEASVEDIYLI